MGDQRGKYTRNVGDVLAPHNATDPSSPDTFIARSVSRFDATDSTIALATTGKMTLAKVTLGSGDVVTNLTFFSGGTAGATMTSWWLALYSPTGVLMAQTLDQAAGAIGANAEFTKALVTAQRIKESGIYRIGLCIAAATVPTVVGLTIPPAMAGPAEGVVSEETTATYTTTAPPILPALTARRGTPYFVAT